MIEKYVIFLLFPFGKFSFLGRLLRYLSWCSFGNILQFLQKEIPEIPPKDINTPHPPDEPSQNESGGENTE